MTVRELTVAGVPPCRAEEPLDDAIRRMADAGVEATAVVDRTRRVVGLLTERDICWFLCVTDSRPSTVAVEEAMRVLHETCREDDSLEHASRLMQSRHVTSIPVVSDQGAYLGMIRRIDVEPYVRRTTPVAA